MINDWFDKNRFHVSEFADIDELLALKEEKKLSISLGLPALNEAETIGHLISVIKGELVDKHPLIDDMAVIDSDSTDKTGQIAEGLGVRVIRDGEVLKGYGRHLGKGEALWKSLYELSGDIIVWIDSDIKNINPGFIYGLVGPLLKNESIMYVKGFYNRPIEEGGQLKPKGGGRVTELVARPLINLFFPELAGIIQPLSGEYAGRRKLLEEIGFYTGYGVEMGHLIGIVRKFGLEVIGQVDLIERIHRNQDLAALSEMSFAIISVMMEELGRERAIRLVDEATRSMKLIRQTEGHLSLVEKVITDKLRPPMIEVEEYVKKFKKGA